MFVNSYIDILITSVTFISCIVGYLRGATKELFTLISWGGSALLTIKLFPISQIITKNFISQPLLSDIVAGIAVFVLFLIILSSLSYLFSSIIKNSIFSLPDRLCGFVFGFIRGIFLLACFDFIIINFVFTNNISILENSRLHPYIQQISKMTFNILPENIQYNILKHLNVNQQNSLINKFQQNVKKNVFDEDIARKIIEKQNKDSQSAEELAKLQIKKSKNVEQETFNKTKEELDKLLEQVGD